MSIVDFGKRICESALPSARQWSRLACRRDALGANSYLVENIWRAPKLGSPELIVQLDTPYCRLEDELIDHLGCTCLTIGIATLHLLSLHIYMEEKERG